MSTVSYVAGREWQVVCPSTIPFVGGVYHQRASELKSLACLIARLRRFETPQNTRAGSSQEAPPYGTLWLGPAPSFRAIVA
jgi:hypothetical protein